MLKNLLVLVVLFCFANSVAWSQTATPATSTAAATAPSASTMPTDPAELMKLAAEVNGLHSDKLAPWHLKLSFQLYDFKGKPTEKGTFEEFWITPKEVQDHLRQQILQPNRVGNRGRRILSASRQ